MAFDNTFQYSDFTPVVSRKKRKQTKERPSLLTLVQRAGEELAKDDWNARCQQLLRDHLTACPLVFSQVLCLGLGSPSSSPNSRAQLAFLLEICKSVPIKHDNVSIYDPVFSAEDGALFEKLGFRMLSGNKDGKHTLDAPTILWMPHCDMDLHESLLAANWSREQLERMVLISNRLTDYVDGNPVRKLEIQAPCLLRLESVLQCCLLPVSPAFPTAFNSTAIQSVGRNAELPESWFTDSGASPPNPAKRSSDLVQLSDDGPHNVRPRLVLAEAAYPLRYAKKLGGTSQRLLGYRSRSTHIFT
ncbi:SRR1-domain-containing protein [Mycena haematopus]|nr:SRR1-domain-containing protein [Mycena haematopus]